MWLQSKPIQYASGLALCGLGLLLLMGGASTDRSADNGSGDISTVTPDPRGRLVRVTLPITNNTDKRVKSSIDRAIRGFSAEGKRPVLVLEFWSAPNKDGSGSEFERSLSLARYLASDELSGIRTVAFLSGDVTGHAVLAVLACEEIVMAPDARLGNAGIDEVGSKGDSGVIGPTMRRGYSEIAERRHTIPTPVALGMLDPELKVVQVVTAGGTRFALEDELEQLRQENTIQSINTVIPAGDMGIFDGRTLRKDHKFVSHLASDRTELASAMDLAADQLELDPSMGDGWRPIRIDLKGPMSAQNVSRVIRGIKDGLAAKSANFVCLTIDSAGGRPEESVRLANYLASLDGSSVRTVAFIEGSARGDAALIAFACDHLVMQNEAVLGGAGAHEMSSSEIESAKQAIKQMAQAKGRRWSLPVAVIDPNLTVNRYSLNGSDVSEYFCDEELKEQRNPGRWIKVEAVTNDDLLRMDAERAESLSLARYVVSGFDEFKASYQLEEDPDLIEPSWAHELIDSLAAPHVAGTLLFFAGFALVAELMSPGVGVGGFVSVVCFALYFWSQFLHGTADALEIILFLVGALCLIVEFFVIPGLGIFGVGGGVLIVASLILASQTFIVPQNEYQLQQMPRSMLTVSSAAGGILVGLILLRKYLNRAPVLRGVMLPALEGEELEEQLRREALVDWGHLIDEVGTTTTPLMPSGKARFGDELVDVMSNGEAVPRGSQVKVVQVSGNRVMVKSVG